MLKQRIITALVMLAVLLPAIFYQSTEPFIFVSAVLLGAAGWEWARLNGSGPKVAQGLGLGLGASLMGFALVGGLSVDWSLLWVGAGLVWIGVGWVMLHRGVAGWRRWPQPLRLWLGLLLLSCAWLALVKARQLGIGFLLSALTLVWMADVAAYAGGKTFGRRKLAPSLSPGKSWEGALSGALGVLALGVFWVWMDRQGWTDSPSLFSLLWAQGPVLALLAVVGLSAMSVVGDLLESLVKRSAGMKDSSQLLPGHGGVLDRVDALLPVLPLAMLLTQL
ncbi:phosphatidate cytidylyltransferase [Hydrogenophaga crassostreae]|uniref:Phosphatidate cytidylyltransferase n=1 Tax=Hydrogenophaga crassostreae TaxID=1763535 RepID=A0A163CIW0_9BURK|nr:phosphatidate cytidylyltransferase [Hydrogenophaga crassostreae]AOW13222.1 phosphatidate cytidylyltransferase [Hydrogenophaga crassostreae]OAD42630.1 phosphatidate cytidylyltransferase [Hydrogenophaga crassostreae]